MIPLSKSYFSINHNSLLGKEIKTADTLLSETELCTNHGHNPELVSSFRKFSKPNSVGNIISFSNSRGLTLQVRHSESDNSCTYEPEELLIESQLSHVARYLLNEILASIGSKREQLIILLDKILFAQVALEQNSIWIKNEQEYFLSIMKKWNPTEQQKEILLKIKNDFFS